MSRTFKFSSQPPFSQTNENIHPAVADYYNFMTIFTALNVPRASFG